MWKKQGHGAVLQRPTATHEEFIVLDTKYADDMEATVDITVEGSSVQQVSDVTYLGMIISSDGTIDGELSAPIGKASGAFNQQYLRSRIYPDFQCRRSQIRQS